VDTVRIDAGGHKTNDVNVCYWPIVGSNPEFRMKIDLTPGMDAEAPVSTADDGDCVFPDGNPKP
jgi:hypothetical protein